MTTNFGKLETSLRYSVQSIIVNTMYCIPFLSVALEKEEGNMVRKRLCLEQMSQKLQKDRYSPSQTHFYLCVGFLHNYHVKALNSEPCFLFPTLEIDSPYIMVYLQPPWQDTQRWLFI